MSDYIYTTQSLYEATSNGLDILLKYLQLSPAQETGKKPFCFRDEKTPSAYIFNNGKYFGVKDFGGKFYSPIDIAIEKTGLEFNEVIKNLYKEFNVEINGVKQTFLPIIEQNIISHNDTRQNGWFEIEEMEYKNLDLVYKNVTPEIANKYDFVQVASYSKIKIDENNKKKILKFTSTPDYPIFAYKHKDFAKIYCPKANKTEFKHSFIGIKKQDHVFGYELFLEKLENINKEIKQSQKNDNYTHAESLIKDLKNIKLFIASGGSDGLSLASFGYDVIWTNSEAETISKYKHDELNRTYENICKNYKVTENSKLQIFNLPDVDKSGIGYAYTLAEKFWKIKTIYLPAHEFHSNGKDFRDWLKFHDRLKPGDIKFKIDTLTTTALQFYFIGYGPKGAPMIISTYLHYFLKIKGFGIYNIERNFNDKTAEKQYIFIQKSNNIATQVFEEDIRKFTEKYFYDKGVTISIIDLIKNTEQFSKKRLGSLDRMEVTVKNYDIEMQRFYFKNNFIEISKNGIEYKNYEKLDTEVWNTSIIDKKLIKPVKEIEVYNEETKTNIKKIVPNSNFEVYECKETNRMRPRINIKDNDFMNYLINGSRVHWKKDLQLHAFNTDEEKTKYQQDYKFSLCGPNLTPEEIEQQEKHFLNKCYNLGYLLHRYKVMSNAKMVYIMDDNTKDEENDSNGRSGKSLFVVSLQQLLMNEKYINGKNINILKDNFLFDGYDKDTDFIYIEDLDQYVGIQFFYNYIASKIPVNPKNGKPYTVPFKDTSKMVTTSNFGIANMDQSTFGRLEFVSFSDYYHLKMDNDERYLEKRTPRTEFGEDFFEDSWFKHQQDKFFFFLFECCQFYLNNTETNYEAPKNNIYKTNSQAKMGTQFIDWAKDYFYESQDAKFEDGEVEDAIEGTLNAMIPRDVMYADYVKKVGERYKKTQQNFKVSLKEYCKTNDYEFCPPNHIKFGKYWREEKKTYSTSFKHADGKFKTTEFIAICTKPKIESLELIINEKNF